MPSILIVDDNHENRYLLEMLFKGHNYEVTTASNGVEALGKARLAPPDVVITDILMPVMDGYTLCREWKADRALSNVPLIFYTATYTDPKDEVFGLSLGADRFIIKPVDPEILEQFVREVLARSSLRNSTEVAGQVQPETFMKDYSEVLFRKLEKKMADLEQINRSMAIEIAERKRAEDALREQQMFSANLIQNSAIAAFVLDRTHKVMLWNKACEELTSCPASIMIGTDDQWKPFYSSRRPTAADDVIDHNIEGLVKLDNRYMKSALNPQAIKSEGWYKNLGGKDRYLVLEAAPIFNSKGELVAAMEMLQDITESKRLEEQLLQSQKMEALGRLSGGIAHDFNNLLTAVIGYSDLALNELPEEHSVKGKITIVRDTGEKASDLVKQLLAFSRNQALEMKPVNLSQVVLNMSRIFERTLGEDIVLELNIDGPVANISADTGQIEQILMNLVVNARDAMPNGGRLIIETGNVYLDETYALMHSQLVEPGPYVILSVTDSGTGMSREIQEKIFEPFFTTKEMGRGSGLGLSTTYGIIKQHNGYIWVYSEPDQGTTFKVYLPAVEEEERKAERDESSITVKGTETILVVDDNPMIRQFVIDVLQPLGYKIFEAGSPEEALIIREQLEKIDVLLTDLIMPNINGNELRKSFMKKWPDIKVIIMSGYGGENILHEEMEDAIFIPKPLTPRRLAAKLREVLD